MHLEVGAARIGESGLRHNDQQRVERSERAPPLAVHVLV
jgi:hypothetical protein